MKDNIVIFGASSGGLKVAQTLINIGLDIEFFVDNDSNKEGLIIEGKVIKNPKCLIETNKKYKIIIASIYHKEIEEQLINLGISKQDIVLKEKYILDYIDNNLKELVSYKEITFKSKKRNSIFIDLAEGISLGGIEKWSITLSEALYNKNYNVTILTNNDISNIELPNLKSRIQRFDLSFNYYIESIITLANEIISNLPCTIIINKINQIYFAAHIVKKLYGNYINIISVLHSDFSRTYQQNELLNDNVDTFLCVSNDVKQNFASRYKIDKAKVFFKDSPIEYSHDFVKRYSDSNNPIIIGYGARLEKAQKRADLLISLILRLEEMNINYMLNIAGDGSYYNKLLEFINYNDLEHKVIMHGIIPFEKMNIFWAKCDIFVNLSDIEGIGLSMLEAMSLGVVPVVTGTAGAKSFIDNCKNGYITKIGDIDTIAEFIGILYEDREKLKQFGELSREKIKRKCNIKDYIEYLERFMNN